VLPLIRVALIFLVASCAADLATRRGGVVDGRKLYEAQCAGCHGRAGTGGEGPALAFRKLRHGSDSALAAFIRVGNQSAGMPRTMTMSDADIAKVAVYLRTLGSPLASIAPGDSARGRAIYEGKGGCPACHMIRGKGGNRGPDLTDIGFRRGPAHLRQSVVTPAAELPRTIPPADVFAGPDASYLAYRPVRLETREGERIEGFRVNEDAFTIQVRVGDRFRSFDKLALRSLSEPEGESPMPSYATVFTGAELNDLVAFLARLDRTTTDSVP
jgi:putative heme-binding domain-containing protein